MTTWPHKHYEPWHIITVTDDTAADPRLSLKHPKDCDPDGVLFGECSLAYYVKNFGFDDDKNIPVTGAYRARYWWDNYEADGDGVEVEACAPEDYHADCGRRVAECDCRIVAVLGDVRAERVRQVAEHGEQHRDNGTGGPVMQHKAEEAQACADWLAENGGVDWRSLLLAQAYAAVAEDGVAGVRAGLVKTAALCTAWIEDIDSRTAVS